MTDLGGLFRVEGQGLDLGFPLILPQGLFRPPKVSSSEFRLDHQCSSPRFRRLKGLVGTPRLDRDLPQTRTNPGSHSNGWVPSIPNGLSPSVSDTNGPSLLPGLLRSRTVRLVSSDTQDNCDTVSAGSVCSAERDSGPRTWTWDGDSRVTTSKPNIKRSTLPTSLEGEVCRKTTYGRGVLDV